MNKILLTVSLLLIVTLSFLRSQDYPRLYSVKVIVDVNYDESNRMYFYNYSILSDQINVGNIISFEIDISRYANCIVLDTVGLFFENDGFAEKHFRRRFPALNGKIVPLSFISSPGRWTGSYSNNLTAGWDGYPLIPPGGSMNGYKLMSKGIPTTRQFQVSPRFNVDELFPSIEDTSVNAMTTAQMDSIREAVNFRGWTIGPTAPPINFVPTAWCDSLSSFIKQNQSLGWLSERKGELDDDAITIAKLNRSLTTARQHLVKKKVSDARRELERFVKMVERINNPKKADDREDILVVMTSEAYALLKYNAEYLMTKLSAPVRKK